MKKIFSFLTAILFAGSMMATDYALVTSTADLTAGAKYIIGSAAETSAVFMGTKANNNNRVQTPVIDIADSKIVYQDTILKLELGGTEGHWTFATLNYHGTDGYLSNANSGTTNALYVQADAREFTISFDGNKAVITSTGGNERKIMRYNSGSKCFACYASGQKDIYLYKEVASAPADTYTVAGNSAVAFGTTWAPTNTDNDMTKQTDGTYKWEKANLELAVGKIEFKVCKNHAWDPSYPAQNYELNIAEAGIYTLTITFDPANDNTVNAVATKTGEAEVDPTVAIKGGWDEWAAETAFELAQDKLSASATLHLTADTYTFKVILNGGDWRSNAYQYHRGFPGAANITGNLDDMTIVADVEGDYVFTWTFANDSLGITFPVAPEPPTPAIPVVKLAGSLTSWDVPVLMENQEGDLTATLTLNLGIDHYQLKVVSDDNWLSKYDESGMYTMHRDWNHVDHLDLVNTGDNIKLITDVAGEYTFTWTYADSSLVVTFPAKEEPQPVVTAIYNWSSVEAENVGTTIFGGNSGITTGTVKIHENSDNVPGIKFGSSYVYADGKWIAIKPAEGGFKAGDVLSVSVVFNNSDASKYCQADVYAADGSTRLFRSNVELTLNGYNAGDEIVQTYTLEADQDSLLLGRYGNTGMFITLLKVERAGGDTPEPPTPTIPVVKLAGSLTSWDVPVLMENQEGDLTATLTLNLGIDHYQLKVVSDDNWLSKYDESGMYTMHRDWNHVDHLDLVNTGDNIKLITDVAGEYTFTWTYADSSLVVTFPAAPLKPNYYLIGDSAFVVDGGADKSKAWEPDAIPSFKDTTVLNLKAGVDYIMRLSLNGTWENHRDFRHLTDTAAGLKELTDEYGNHSIGFRLNEAGPVTFIYIPAAEEQPEVFKIEGNFYVAPAPDPSVSVFGTMTNPAWEVEVPFILSDDKSYASLTVENIGAGEYDFKFYVNGEWRSNGYRFHRGFPGCAGITGNVEADMVFVADKAGTYTFYWYFANDSLAIIYPELVLTNGYYLVGYQLNNWTPAADYMLVQNPDNEAEYQLLGVTLALDDSIKVVYVEGDDIKTWYPEEGDNYVIDDHHNGETSIYFRPDYQGGEKWYYGCIYVAPTSTVGFENTAADAKAVKSLRNGILVIEKNNKLYNVLGIEIK